MLKNCASFEDQELLDRCFERHFTVTVVMPRLAFCQQCGSGFHREALGLEAGAHLAPVEWHRDRRAWSHARGERSHGRRHAIVAEVIEEDLSGTKLLRHVQQIALRAVLRHG